MDSWGDVDAAALRLSGPTSSQASQLPHLTVLTRGSTEYFGHTLARRARRTLNLDLDRQFDQLSLGASWQAISSSYDAEDNKNRLAGYYLVGLRSGWALSREVALSLKVDNLLDRRYTRAWYSYDDPNFENNQPYREEGRTWMLGVTWTPQL